MTLHTKILTHQPVDAKELHAWVNEHILHAPYAKFNEGSDGIWNEMEQGLDALMWVTADPEGKPYREWWQDPKEQADLTAEDIAYYEEHAAPEGYTMLHLDTPYGYSPAITHARMIRQLDVQFFQPRGLTFAWYNEFADEWHEQQEGLLEFAGPQGFGAENWFKEAVKPALRNSGLIWHDDDYSVF